MLQRLRRRDRPPPGEPPGLVSHRVRAHRRTRCGRLDLLGCVGLGDDLRCWPRLAPAPYPIAPRKRSVVPVCDGHRPGTASGDPAHPADTRPGYGLRRIWPESERPKTRPSAPRHFLVPSVLAFGGVLVLTSSYRLWLDPLTRGRRLGAEHGSPFLETFVRGQHHGACAGL